MDALWTAQLGLATAIATALLDSLWQGALLAALAALVLRMLAGHSASLRHAVGLLFLLAMVVAPAASFAGFWMQPGTRVNAGWLPAVTAVSTGPGEFVQQSSLLAAALSLLWLSGVAVMLPCSLGNCC